MGGYIFYEGLRKGKSREKETVIEPGLGSLPLKITNAKVRQPSGWEKSLRNGEHCEEFAGVLISCVTNPAYAVKLIFHVFEAM
jgi:hypothetical protein